MASLSAFGVLPGAKRFTGKEISQGASEGLTGGSFKPSFGLSGAVPMNALKTAAKESVTDVIIVTCFQSNNPVRAFDGRKHSRPCVKHGHE